MKDSFCLSQFKSGLVDDLIADVFRVSIARTGLARYAVRFWLHDERVFVVQLWTTKRGHITTQLFADANDRVHGLPSTMGRS